VKRTNHLSENLKAYQKMKGCTQAELSAELGVPVSTLQTLLTGGNTTLDTLLHLSEAMDASLDELVLCHRGIEVYERLRQLMEEFTWYSEMTEERQEIVWYHVSELLRILKRNEGEASV